jgi:hypothetical protein
MVFYCARIVKEQLPTFQDSVTLDMIQPTANGCMSQSYK